MAAQVALRRQQAQEDQSNSFHLRVNVESFRRTPPPPKGDEETRYSTNQGKRVFVCKMCQYLDKVKMKRSMTKKQR